MKDGKKSASMPPFYLEVLLRKTSLLLETATSMSPKAGGN